MKVAIIGLGKMGVRHVAAARRAGLRVVGGADQMESALQLAAAPPDEEPPLLLQDAREMLCRTRPDCVVVSTTAPTHASYTIMAAEEGAKFILCEKPMATSLEDCDRMLAFCERRRVVLAVNHQMRFLPQYKEVRSICSSDEIGGLSSVTVAAGNFGMAMNATHYFDLFHFLTGEPIHEVTAWLNPDKCVNPRGAQFQDVAGCIRATTRSGRRLYLDASSDQGHGLTEVFGGSLGTVTVDELEGCITVQSRSAENRDLPTTRYCTPQQTRVDKVKTLEVVDSTAGLLKALFDGSNVPTGEDGRNAVSALVAAYVSSETGHVSTRLDGDLPRQRVFPWA